MLRATQFHEFASQIHGQFRFGPIVLIPAMKSQPVAARAVAARGPIVQVRVPGRYGRAITPFMTPGPVLRANARALGVPERESSGVPGGWAFAGAWRVRPDYPDAMAADQFSFTAEVWEHDGPGSWHFVSLPATLADQIEERFGRYAAGFGSVRVQVTVNATRWSTSLFPDRKRETYVLPVKKAVRTAEGLRAGTRAEFRLRVLVGPVGNPAESPNTTG